MSTTSFDNVFNFSRDVISSRNTWSLEASAGTGKTWTIENFVTHYLANGDVHPDEVVVVTFTRMAARELQSRIRSNVAVVASSSTEYDADERRTLRNALADFSQMRITTIHGFAQRCLITLGDPLGELSNEVNSEQFRSSVLSDVLREVPESLAQRFGDYAERHHIEEVLRTIAANPNAELIASAPSQSADELIRVVDRARIAVSRRKAELGIAGFDDLLTRLNRRLDNPDDARTIASGIKVLLVDEFQDTDGLQWEIFQKISNATALKSQVVVGDPKQAIYGFRGGDVQVYREAVSEHDAHLLVGNRRSTSNFVGASNIFFADTSFGIKFPTEVVRDDLRLRDVDIPYVPVAAAGELRDAPSGPSWVFRHVEGSKADVVRDNAGRDLAQYIRHVVGHDTIPDVDLARRESTPSRLVRHDDVCILVLNNHFAVQLLRELQRNVIPATVIGGANVFASAAASQWRYLLAALARPSSGESARLLALSWFGGSTLREIAEQRDEEDWLSVRQQQLLHWHDLFSSANRHDFLDTLIEESGVLEFLVGQPFAERNITDVQHVAEVLRTRDRDSLEQLDDFLKEANTSDDGDQTSVVDVVGDQWARRVESDEEAVRIMTVHKAKGLQFPIVLLPFMNAYSQSPGRVAAYRAYRDGVGTTVVDVTASDRSPGAVAKSSLAAAEHLRKAYVALTRAQVRNVLWTWDDSNRSAYGPVIRSDRERRHLATEHHDLFEYVEGASSTTASPPHRMRPTERARQLALSTRSLTTPRQRLSFSTLSGYVAGSSISPSLSRDVEPISPEGEVEDLGDLGEEAFVTLHSSAQIGRVVHRVLQYADLEASDRRQSLRQSLFDAAEVEGLALDSGSRLPVTSEALLTLVERSLDATLGDVADGRSLGGFTSEFRLPEMGFEFVLTDHSRATWSDVRNLLVKHLGTTTHYREWLDNLTFDPVELRGMMTGSIDAVVAWERSTGPRFLVIDYKTNLVSDTNGVELYDSAALWGAMSDHHYQLQAILYLVALHRYLRGRLPDYDYDTNVAGGAYLFLRGMTPSQPGAGVVALTPPAELIIELSDLFDGSPHE